MTWALWLGSGLIVLVIASIGLTALGERRWRRQVTSLCTSLEAARLGSRPHAATTPMRYDARESEDLPAPVRRYFHTVLEDGQPVIAAVTVNVAGTFNMSPTGEQWKQFTSRQRVVTRRPGFVWDANIAMAPGVSARVVDSYIAGKGLLRATLQGLFTMAEQTGDDIDRSEFMRWFAEMPWYPTALLPSQGVRWEAVDDHSANATMADGPLGLTLLFRFDDAGLITSFRAEARGGIVGGTMVMAPWEGRWSDYRMCDGIRVPFTGEVAWMRPEGRRSYFIGTVTSLEFEFSPPSSPTGRP